MARFTNRQIHNFTSFPLLLQNFLNYDGTIKNNATSTVQAYAYDLSLFLKYMVFSRDTENQYIDINNIDISQLDEDFFNSITQEDILDYLYYLKNVRNSCAETRSRRLIAVKVFFNYLYSHKKVIDKNPAYDIDTPKKAKHLPIYLTESEAIALLNSLDRNKVTYERDYCILVVFLNCGLRVSELVNVDLQDIRDDDTLRVTGKGNKQRTLYLNPACKSAITSYIEVRTNATVPIKDKNALFISPFTGKRITVRRTQQIVQDALKAAHLDGMGYSPHKLRHTAATLMYQNGVDVRTLKDVLGHEQLNTTQIYTHLDRNQLKAAADMNPLANVTSQQSKKSS